MKATMLTAIAAAIALVCAPEAFSDVSWRNINDSCWRSGPKLTPEKLRGKVVLVDKWGVRCPPCRRSLPHVEALWKKFHSKPFIIVGAHCQGDQRDRINELVKENNLTYSIYQDAGIADEPRFPGIPAFYIIAPNGKVVYQECGFSDARAKELEDVIKAELDKMPAYDSLCSGVALQHFKAEAKNLILGKNVEGVSARLKSAAKKADAKASEAQAILDSISAAHDALFAEIRENARTRPGLALIRIETFMKTWPSEKARCAKAYQKLSSSPDVKAAVKLRRTLESLEQKPPRNAIEEKKAAETRKAAKAAAAPFAGSEFPGVANEIAELLAQQET